MSGQPYTGPMILRQIAFSKLALCATNHVFWSANAGKGYVELWHNGVKQNFKSKCSGQKCAIATLRPDSGIVYAKQGIYRKDINTAPAVLYHDGFVISKSEAGLGGL